MSTSPYLSGSCACGLVRYTSTGPPLPDSASNCHCETCRRLAGAPFGSWIGFKKSDITFIFGQPSQSPMLVPADGLQPTSWPYVNGSYKERKSSEIAARGFCQDCGSQICIRFSTRPERISIPMGTIDLATGTVDEEGLQEGGKVPAPVKNIFVKEKASWWDSANDSKTPQHNEYSDPSFGKQ